MILWSSKLSLNDAKLTEEIKYFYSFISAFIFKKGFIFIYQGKFLGLLYQIPIEIAEI